MSATPQPVPQSALPKYPGLFPAEVPILRAWLKLHEGEYESFDYNVRVGTGFDPGPGYSADIRRMAVQNTQYRIDLVASKGTHDTLVEVKQHAGLGAVGQMIGYSVLWRQSHTFRPSPRLLVVTESTQPDLPGIMAAQGIDLEVVKPLGS